MKSKFNTLFESNFNRFQGGGFLTGDIVKLKDGWESHDWCKSAPQQVIDKLKEMNDSDLLMRVSVVKAVRPAVQGSVQQDQGVGDFHVDITQEMAPGRYTGVFVTVPQELIELDGDNSTYRDIPDSLRREDDVDVKPRELEQEAAEAQGDVEKFTHPQKQTGTDDETNKELTDKDIKQPGATGAVSYTAGYIS